MVIPCTTGTVSGARLPGAAYVLAETIRTHLSRQELENAGQLRDSQGPEQSLPVLDGNRDHHAAIRSRDFSGQVVARDVMPFQSRPVNRS